MREKDKKIKVLIVEDEKILRRLLSVYLMDKGFEIESRPAGTPAVEMAGKIFFDSAVIDMSLPDMTGEELLLKLNRIAPEMNFIITTGDANYEPGPEVSGIERKKIRIIPKPASGSKIADTIMKQIKENRDDREA